VLGADPFSLPSGGGGSSLLALRVRGEGEFETIDWTFYQEKDRQCVHGPLVAALLLLVCLTAAAAAGTAAR
jgi:hypothetical protein